MILMKFHIGSRQDEVEERRRLIVAAFISAVLHFGVLLILLRPSPSLSDERIEIKILPELKVREKTVAQPIVPPRPEAPAQVVSVPPTPTEAPLNATRLRAEHDTRAEKEMLKRGENELGVKGNPQTVKPQPVTPAPEPRNITKHEQTASLRLDQDELLNNLFQSEKTEKSKSNKVSDDPEPRTQKFVTSEPFQHSLNASLFRGLAGSTDYLPELPDGDITLLNAKADRFAVFVRRVSLQVFGALRQMNWQELSREELRRLDQFVSVEAVMDRQGKLLKVNIDDSSGSTTFDLVTKHAVEKGAWDQNPPSDAASGDGNIHFIFKSRSWSRLAPNGVSEQRWLLLGTGLL